MTGDQDYEEPLILIDEDGEPYYRTLTGERNVASIELCKELFELSAWGRMEDPPYFSTDRAYKIFNRETYLFTHEDYWKRPQEAQDFTDSKHPSFPAYDLGYLLRKLPDGTQLNKTTVQYSASGIYSVNAKTKSFHSNADTPEDAACKLLIELIRQKVV